jgi:hypothetical protein
MPILSGARRGLGHVGNACEPPRIDSENCTQAVVEIALADVQIGRELSQGHARVRVQVPCSSAHDGIHLGAADESRQERGGLGALFWPRRVAERTARAGRQFSRPELRTPTRRAARTIIAGHPSLCPISRTQFRSRRQARVRCEPASGGARLVQRRRLERERP